MRTRRVKTRTWRSRLEVSLSHKVRVGRFVESLLAKVVDRQPKKLVVQEFDFAV